MSDGARAGKAYVELGVKNNLRRDLAQSEQVLRAWGARMATAGSIMMGASAAGLVVFAGMAKSFADAGSQVYDMAKKTGISAESLGALKYAADQSGTSIEAVAVGMKAMNRFTTALATGNEAAATTMKQLGINTQAFLAATPEQRLGMIADALNNIEDEGIRAGMAAKVLGKSGMDLLPMLEGGSAGLAGMTDRARKMGWVLSEEAAKAADELGDTIDDLWQTFRAIVNNIGAAVAPAFTIVGKILVGLGSYAITLIKTNQWFANTLLVATAAIGVFGAAIVGLAGVTYAVAFGLWIYNTALGLYAAMSGIATAVTAAFAAAMATLQAIMLPANLGILLIVASLGVFVALLPLALYKLFELTNIGGAAIDMFGGRVSEALSMAGTGIKAFADAMGNGDIAGAAQIAGQTFYSIWRKTIVGLYELFIGLRQFVSDIVFKIAEMTVGAMTAVRLTVSKIANIADPSRAEAEAKVIKWMGKQELAGVKAAKKKDDAQFNAERQAAKIANANIDAEFKRTVEDAAKNREAEKEKKKSAFAFEMPVEETVKRALSGGAFNAAAARNLSNTPGSLLERQVKEQEKTNKNLEKLQKQLTDMGLEWGT